MYRHFLLVTVLSMLLASCTQQDKDRAKRKLENAKVELRQDLHKAGQEIKRLSLVGYSLGGLVARFCVGLLYSKGFFEKITPVVCAKIPTSLWNFADPPELRNLCNAAFGCAHTSTRMA